MNGINEQTDITAMTMADVALKYPQALGILKKHNLDYCHSGGRSLSDACGREGIDPLLVIHEILGTRLNIAFDNRVDFNSWDLPLIIDFIIQHHHRYLRTTIPDICELLDRLCDEHATEHQVLHSIMEKFYALRKELLSHIEKEEQMLFPLITRLNNLTETDSASLNDICTSIIELEHEHDKAGELIKAIRAFSNCYTPSVHACPLYNITFLKLSFLDDDLVQHLHIENSILFPRAKALASAYLKKAT